MFDLNNVAVAAAAFVSTKPGTGHSAFWASRNRQTKDADLNTRDLLGKIGKCQVIVVATWTTNSLHRSAGWKYVL